MRGFRTLAQWRKPTAGSLDEAEPGRPAEPPERMRRAAMALPAYAWERPPHVAMETAS